VPRRAVNSRLVPSRGTLVEVGPHRAQIVRPGIKEISAATQIQRYFKMRKAAREAMVNRARAGPRLSEELRNFEMEQVVADGIDFDEL